MNSNSYLLSLPRLLSWTFLRVMPAQQGTSQASTQSSAHYMPTPDASDTNACGMIYMDLDISLEH